jgi:hypothetical protein
MSLLQYLTIAVRMTSFNAIKLHTHVCVMDGVSTQFSRRIRWQLTARRLAAVEDDGKYSILCQTSN